MKKVTNQEEARVLLWKLQKTLRSKSKVAMNFISIEITSAGLFLINGANGIELWPESKSQEFRFEGQTFEQALNEMLSYLSSGKKMLICQADTLFTQPKKKIPFVEGFSFILTALFSEVHFGISS